MTRHHKFPAAWLAALLLPALALAQPSPDLRSGPQPGQGIPDSFHPFNINGEFGIQRADGKLQRDGRHHSLVCEYGLFPTLMIIAKEGTAKDSQPLKDLARSIDEAIDKDETKTLHGFIVFLSQDAHSSVTEGLKPADQRTVDPAKLVEEAVQRDQLKKRLEDWSQGLRHFVVSTYPESGPPGYSLADKAEITVVLYERHKALFNWAFEEGKLRPEDVAAILAKVQEVMGKTKRGGA